MLSDTAPGYTKHSAHFAVTFVTGEQCGANSAIIEWQTDWHDIMAIILAGLEAHPDHVDEAASVMAANLDTWALAQPGGAQLQLHITVTIAEGRYFLPPLGRRKELRIDFNDRFRTRVLFHIAKKPVRLESLRRLATVAVADHLLIPHCGGGVVAAAAYRSLELPRNLAAEVRTALHFSWTARQYWRGVGRCLAWCPCQRSWSQQGSGVVPLDVDSREVPTRDDHVIKYGRSGGRAAVKSLQAINKMRMKISAKSVGIRSRPRYRLRPRVANKKNRIAI